MDQNLSIFPVAIFCMCFSEDSEFIYTGDDNGTIKIWSTLTGGIVETFRLFCSSEEKSAITDLIAYNKCLIACNENKEVVIWDTRTMQIYEKFSLDESLSNLNGYTYKQEGIEKHLLIIGSQVGKIYIIDMDMKNSKDEEYKKLFPLKIFIDKSIQDNYLLGKPTKPLELTGLCSDDYNDIIVSGFIDGLVCIWDTYRLLNVAIQKRKPLNNLNQFVFYAQLCHRTTVQLIEFSQDKTHFLTGSLDGSVLVWRLVPEMMSYIRKEFFINGTYNFGKKYPVSTLTRIIESEDRVKCNVNVATWTKKNNYIIAMISSKPRKKHKLGNNVTNYGEVELIDDDIYYSKRTSSLIVYSLKLNKIIHKYNEKSGIKGLDFIDENYIFGCHPLYEEIIFTLSGARNIILFNIKKGEIIKKFKQNDFFFEFDKRKPLACEGMFSKNGDYFAITSYSGALSIFSIYSKNSYSATYMNQFYSIEFDPNLEQISNNSIKTGIPSLSSIFPVHVNMHNLPYIIEQPYSLQKLEQIKNNKKLINDKYCISNKELKHRFLSNNLIMYEKNFQERISECQKEEKNYYEAEKDNMNYRANRIINQNEEQANIQLDDLIQGQIYNRENEANYIERYREDNLSEGDNESNMDLSSDDLRIISTLRNENNNLNENHRRGNYQRTSTRYNLRNSIINNTSSHSNSINRNNDNNNNSGRNYNLRTRIEVTSIDDDSDDDDIIINNNEPERINNNNNNTNNNVNKRRRNIIEDEEEEFPKQKEKDKEKEKKKEKKKQRPDAIFIVHRRIRKEDKEKEKEKNAKERRHYRRHGKDDEDEDYIDTKSPRRRRRKYKKRTKKKKAKHEVEEEEEEDDGDSEYRESESEENKEDHSKMSEESEIEKDKDEDKDKEDIKESSEDDKDSSDNNIDIDDDEETYTMNSKHKKPKKLIKKNKVDSEDEIKSSSEKNSKEKSDEIKINNQEINTNSNTANKQQHKLLTSEIFGEQISNNSISSSPKEDGKLPKEKITNDHLQHECYFCHYIFTGDKKAKIKLFGPFYYNKKEGKVLSEKTEENSEEKEIYIDINCFPDNIGENYLKNLEEVIKEEKSCVRCGSPYTTKKCYLCDRMFHGNLCFNQMTEEYDEHKYCLECYKKKYLKHINGKKIRPNEIEYEKLEKKYFLGTKINISKYFPQKGEDVYFILHSYMLFLKKNYQYIIYEIDDEKQKLFFWLDNTYQEKNSKFNFYEPFLCKVKNIEYIYPQDKTIILIKEKSSSNQFYKNLKVLIKLTLQIVNLDKTEITIILFENDNSDFLIRKKIYEETLKYYNEKIITKKDTSFKINLPNDDIIEVKLKGDKQEEKGKYFSKSKFNSLNVITEKDKKEKKISFWNININHKINLINDKMKYLITGLKETIDSICKKNKKEVEIFMEIVSDEIASNYYKDIQVPMYLKLILSRLENKYYITEESIKFDIQLLVDNVKTFNTGYSKVSEDAEILKKRLFNRIEQLLNNYKEKKNVISNGTSIKINLNSDSGSGNESAKKILGKKRKRINDDENDNDENKKKDYDDSEDYLFFNNKKSKSTNNITNTNESTQDIILPISDSNTESNISTGNNNYNSISINIQINNNGNNGSVIKKKKKKKMF